MINQTQLDAINNVICCAIIHGGDSGGAYFSLGNFDKVLNTLTKELNCKIVWFDDYDLKEHKPYNYSWKSKYDFDYEEPNSFPWLVLS